MKFIHTSDWHLGRSLGNVSLLADQAVLLDQVFEAVKAHNVEALIIAGDIYDRPVPPGQAVKLFDDFLRRIYTQTRAAIIAIAGNHDSPERVGFGADLYDPARVLIRGRMEVHGKPLVIETSEGVYAFSALPYGEIHAARRVYDTPDIKTPEDVLIAELDAAQKTVPAGACHIVVAHGFIAGSAETEGERPLSMVAGTLGHAKPAIFDGVDYVALGHLHKPQQAGKPHIRYCGAWMGFGFDEADQEKSMLLVDMDAAALLNIETIPFVPKRCLRVLRGAFENVLATAQKNPSDDFIKVELENTQKLHDPMGRLREYYPNLLQVEWVKRSRSEESTGLKLSKSIRDPQDVVAAFVQDVTGHAPEGQAQDYIAQVLDAVSVMDKSQERG